MILTTKETFEKQCQSYLYNLENGETLRIEDEQENAFVITGTSCLRQDLDPDRCEVVTTDQQFYQNPDRYYRDLQNGNRIAVLLDGENGLILSASPAQTQAQTAKVHEEPTVSRRKERQAELWSLSPKHLIDRIRDYPDQDRLNRNDRFPIGRIAQEIADRNYRMSGRQHASLINQFTNVTGKQVEAKERELSRLSRQELVDRICSYPDQRHLDYHAGRDEKHLLPVGEFARDIQASGYRMSENQRILLLRTFAERTADETYEMEQARRPVSSHVPEPVPEPVQTVSEPAYGYRSDYALMLNGRVPDPEDRAEINRHLAHMCSQQNFPESLRDTLIYEDESTALIRSIRYELTDESQGRIVVETDEPLDAQEQVTVQHWIRQQNAGPVEACLRSCSDGIVYDQPGSSRDGILSDVVDPYLSQIPLTEPEREDGLTAKDLAGLNVPDLFLDEDDLRFEEPETGVAL